MNRHVANIAGRLSLRPPQKQSLETLARVCVLAPPAKDADRAAALEAIRREFPHVTDFERDFPSLCFALATGVGKTRLMGAFITYLYLAHGIRNFFVLAPNLTIYQKLIADFTPNTPKYVFHGIDDFAINPPVVITGDNYEHEAASLHTRPDDLKVNVFNISKINSEVRGGKAPRIKRLSEYIGESYFEYLAKLPDLVLLMDESHRYRASAGVKAINELKPVLGLELTATPFVEVKGRPERFKNVIVDYPIGRALVDGFVKEPAVITRKDFTPGDMSREQIEKLKLEDGVRLHEALKVELVTYSGNAGVPLVKPFVLVIARDTTHAAQLHALIQSDAFFEGRYRDLAIQVDSSKAGKEEDEMVGRLLKVEDSNEKTEIVIHVNMLKEGWDVTNLYTIVPLRAASARVLIEQSIGRGLRLPYGKRTGVPAVDRLNIIAHDKFQEIVEDSRKADSPIQLTHLVLDPRALEERTVTVVSQPRLAEALAPPAPAAAAATPTPSLFGPPPKPIFATETERKAARIAAEVIQTYGSRPSEAPTLAHLETPDLQAKIAAEVERRLGAEARTLFSNHEELTEVVRKTTQQAVLGSIDIPRITLVPTGKVKSGYHPFTLDLTAVRYPKVADELWAQNLRDGNREVVAVKEGGIREARLENYVVRGLVDFDDVSYDDHADFLYALAEQAVRHFKGYLKDDEAVRKVLAVYQRPLAELIHAQMQAHYWEEAEGYETQVSRGFTELRESAYTAIAGEAVLDFRSPPPDKRRIEQYLFSGFDRCLYRLQKFQSDPERRMAVVLERESLKWFRPAKGQFQIYYRFGHEEKEYLPDFVAETAETIYMIEAKRETDLQADEVKAKQRVAVEWCGHATNYSKRHGGKPWTYLLIPNGVITENMTLAGLASKFHIGK